MVQPIGPMLKVAGTESKVGGCFCQLLTKTWIYWQTSLCVSIEVSHSQVSYKIALNMHVF